MPVTDVTTSPEDLTIRIVADFAHPVHRVWQAYTDPRQLERFWGPPTWPATFTTWDHTVGGRSLYHMTGPKGEKSYAGWEFLEISPETRFVVLDFFADENGSEVEAFPAARMEMNFEPTEQGTRMTAVSKFPTLESLEQVLEMGVIEGTTQAMGQIDAVLEGLREYAQGKGTRVELLSDTLVRFTRLIEGPRELVWRAHNDPDLIRQWMLGPDGWEMSTCDVASSAGDRYQYAWSPVGDTEGEPFGFDGELLLVDAPVRAVTTERMTGMDGPATVNDLQLHEEDGATLVTTVIEYPDKQARDMILGTGMADGMEASYVRLERLLPQV